MNSNERKSKQLGIPFGTATNKLKKKILFSLIKQLKLDICFHCNLPILTENELSIEHKIPWEGKDIALFWDLDNIAFSHLICNITEGGKTLKGHRVGHGSSMYDRWKCRCDVCKLANTLRRRKYRKNKPF